MGPHLAGRSRLAASPEVEILRCLKGLGVDLSACNAAQKNAATCAAVEGEVAVLQCLHSLGVDLSASDTTKSYGQAPATALARRCTRDMIHVLRCLHDMGVDLSDKDAQGHTPAVLAAGSFEADNSYGEDRRVDAEEAGARAVEALKYLHSVDVNLSACDGKGRTPATAAAGVDFVEALTYLHSIGVDLSAADGRGMTPMAETDGVPRKLKAMEYIGSLNVTNEVPWVLRDMRGRDGQTQRRA